MARATVSEGSDGKFTYKQCYKLKSKILNLQDLVKELEGNIVKHRHQWYVLREVCQRDKPESILRYEDEEDVGIVSVMEEISDQMMYNDEADIRSYTPQYQKIYNEAKIMEDPEFLFDSITSPFDLIPKV